MDDKGEILSSYDVDENIILQMWSKGLSPRLVIYNKNQKSRKLVRLNWLEKLDRKLSVKGKKRGSSVEYRLADLLPYLQRVLSEYVVYTSFKPRLWKFAMALEKVLHAPAVVSEKGELSLLPEEKRVCLWIADIVGSKKGEGSFRPFFPFSEKEREVLLEKDLSITENRRGAENLFKTGLIRKLANQNPPRWHNPIRFMASAMLLSFSFCEEDGSEFSDELWRGETPEQQFPSFKIGDARLRGIDRKFASFVRHFEAVEKIQVRTSLDSDKELLDSGYARKRRIEFPLGLVGDVGYAVTFFEHEEGMMALGCKPKAATLRHQGELIYSFPAEIYQQALSDDSFGGASDDYFTVTQLASAKEFAIWCDNLIPYISSFAGLV